jgi:mRNA interferase RelE/StbE
MSDWSLDFKESGFKDLSKLDKPIQQKILQYLKTQVIASNNPRLFGKQLSGPLKEFWRYRVGDYRVICSIEDLELIVLVIKVKHRKEVYE